MFSARIENEDEYSTVALVFEGEFTIDMGWEYPNVFLDSEIIKDINARVTFDTPMPNGTFYIKLGDKVTITISRHGSGLGGYLSIELERTPEISLSFSNAVREISDYIKEHPDHFPFNNDLL